MPAAAKILIDLAANVAKLSTDLTQATNEVKSFGDKVTGTSKEIENAFEAVKKAIIGSVAYEALKQVVDYVNQLDTKFSALADQASKLGASFEEFEKLRLAAMDAAGGGTDKLVDSMTRLKGVTDQALQGNSQIITSLNRLGVTILDANGKLRSQVDINERIAAALLKMPEGIEKTRLEFQLLGQAGADVERTLQTLATSQADLATKFGSIGLGKTLDDLQAMRDRSAQAQEKLELLIAAIALPIKATFLESAAAAMERITNAINAVSLGNLDDLYRVLLALGTGVVNPFGAYQAMQGFGSKNPVQVLDEQIQTATQHVEKLKDEIRTTVNSGNEVTQQQRDNLAAAAREQERLEFARAKLQPSTVIDMRNQGGRGSNPPPVGGGSGGADQDNIERQISRYQKLTESAKRAYDTIVMGESTSLEYMQREVRVQQQIDDIVAQITTKRGRAPTPEEIERLREAVTANEKQRDTNAKLLQSNVQAVATEDRLGDGTLKFRKIQQDLNNELATGRLSQDAFNRAMKEAQEQTTQAALAAQRYDDNLGSLGAGFEAAALKFQRSNDLYSTGEQLFTNSFQLMSQAISDFVKTGQLDFAKLAQSFASMLADMAAKLAASAAINFILKALGGAFGSSEVTPGPAPAGGYQFTFTGSDGATPIIAAPGHAGGGDVLPGISYRVGERGPERFIPRIPGRIEPNGGGRGGVTINNYAPAVDVNAERRPSGDLLVTVQAVRRALTRDVARGGNDFASAMENTYRLGRARA